MAIQTKWEAIPAVAVTLGPLKGEVTLPNPPPKGRYRVKMTATIQASGFSDLNLCINRVRIDPVTGSNIVSMGAVGSNINSRFDFVAAGYTTGVSLAIAEQDKRGPDSGDVSGFEYEQDPVNAKRVYIVDDLGQPLGTAENPLASTAELVAPPGGIEVDIEWAKTPSISNLSLSAADTEVPFVFPSNTQRFLVRVRNSGANLRLAFEANGTNTAWLTVPRGCNYTEGDLDVDAGFTMYLQADAANQVVEIISWAK